MKKNTDKYVLITGATSGIGYELARLFARDGYNLVIVARMEKRLNEVATELEQEFGINVLPMVKDLFQPDAASEIYHELLSLNNIRIHALVNDAGQGEWGNFIDVDIKRSLEIIQLNISTLVSLTWYFLKDMKTHNEGLILQLGSEVSKAPAPLLSVYAATKAFVLSFTEALIYELKDTNITMTLLMPGATDTDFFRKAHAEHTVNYREKELADPVEVAQAGYKALMNGDRRIIYGASAKTHVAMSNLMPDNAGAANFAKNMQESDKENGRTEPEHEASRRERRNSL